MRYMRYFEILLTLWWYSHGYIDKAWNIVHIAEKVEKIIQINCTNTCTFCWDYKVFKQSTIHY